MNNCSEVECPHCQSTELYEFDDLPEFFPNSWNLKL